MTTENTVGSTLIEHAGIEIIPESERHAKPRDLFWPWFAANVSVFSMTYGSYLGRETPIGRTCLYIGAADTAIALLAGLSIFAIVFAQGLEPAAGPGLILQTLARNLFRPKQWRITPVVAHIEQIGLNAAPIVVLLTFMVGAVVAFLGATVLANFGAGIFTVDLVAFSFLREFGVLLTAILLAGRTRFPVHLRALLAYAVGGLALFTSMALTYWGARFVHSGLISVMFGLAPLMAGIMASFVLGEKSLTVWKVLGTLLGVTGLGVVFLYGADLGGEHFSGGLAALVGSVFFYSAGLVWLKRIGDDSPPLATTVTATSGMTIPGDPLLR